MIMSTTSSQRQQRVHLGALLQQHQRAADRRRARPAPRWATSVSARLLARASRPPLSTTALPLFQASPVICTRASGRASNTTPSTPSGQVTRSSTRPRSSSRWVSRWPTSSGMRASWRRPSAQLASLPVVEPQPLDQRRGQRPARLVLAGPRHVLGVGRQHAPRAWPAAPAPPPALQQRTARGPDSAASRRAASARGRRSASQSARSSAAVHGHPPPLICAPIAASSRPRRTAPPPARSRRG